MGWSSSTTLRRTSWSCRALLLQGRPWWWTGRTCRPHSPLSAWPFRIGSRNDSFFPSFINSWYTVTSRHPNKINTNYFKKFWTTNVTPMIFFSKFTPTMWHQYNNMPENPQFWCQLIYRDKYHHALSSRHIRKVHSSMPAPTQPTNPNIWLVIFMLSKKIGLQLFF